MSCRSIMAKPEFVSTCCYRSRAINVHIEAKGDPVLVRFYIDKCSKQSFIVELSSPGAVGWERFRQYMLLWRICLI